jgi:drug/metabolite transporter (DMT)-like permease
LRRHPQFKAYLALAAVCFFWGTTYLGIKMALETFPPATLVSIRYLISGSVLVGAALWKGVQLPRGRELLVTCLLGVVILGIGNGCLSWAELLIPSGLAALFITTSPFWMVGVEALLPGGERLHGPTIAGMLVGLCGTLLLVAPHALHHNFGGPVLRGFLILQLGCCGWAFGSIAQRRRTAKAHPVVSGAVQQLATGLIYVVPALLLPAHPIRWSARGVGALFYLITFGSIVGYSAYVYALEHLPVSVISLYNYVNPVVAVLLGWLFYGEKLEAREMAAIPVIFGGVALVKHFSARVGRAEPAACPDVA